MKIRKAKVKDFPEYYRLFRLIIRTHEEIFLNGFLLEMVSLTKDHKKYLKKEFRQYIYSKNKTLLFAEENNKIIGLIGGTIAKYPKYYKANKEGFVDSLYVIKEFRGKRISTQLKNQLFSWFKEKKMKYVGLEVLDKNYHAQKIYQKWGFKYFIRKMKLQLK